MKQALHSLFLLFASVLAALSCLKADPVLASSVLKAEYQLPAETNAFQRGLIALQENRIEDALSELTLAQREHPDDALVRNFRGIVLVRLGKNDQGESEYREALRLDPRMEDAYRNLGFLKWTEHRLQPAHEALEHAVELAPGDSFAHYYLGRVELDEQHYSAAVRELATSRMPLPVDPDFSIQMATAYIATGSSKEARKSLEHLATMPLNDRQSIHVASLLVAIKENASAIGMMQRLNKRSSSSEDSWRQFDLALVYLLSGNYEKAISQADSCNQSLSHGDPKHESADAWTVVGIASAHLKQQERSVNALHHAATLESGDEEHWLNLTRELMEMNRYADAISAVQEGLAANPNSYALRLRLGAAHLAAGHYAEAESVFRELVAAGDPLPTGYIGLAQVLLRTGRAEEAASELAASQKLGPSFLISYFRGLALDRAGKPLEAMMAFHEAAQLNSSNAEVHLSMGKTELGLGRVSDAIAELQEALRLNPGDEQAKRLLSKAYNRAGDAKSAAHFAEASATSPMDFEGDLLGDFFVPKWQMPIESTRQ